MEGNNYNNNNYDNVNRVTELFSSLIGQFQFQKHVNCTGSKLSKGLQKKKKKCAGLKGQLDKDSTYNN